MSSEPILFPQMASVKEAAAASGVAPSRLRELCRTGKVVYIRCGKRWLVNCTDLARFLNEGECLTHDTGGIRRVDL